MLKLHGQDDWNASLVLSILMVSSGNTTASIKLFKPNWNRNLFHSLCRRASSARDVSSATTTIGPTSSFQLDGPLVGGPFGRRLLLLLFFPPPPTSSSSFQPPPPIPSSSFSPLSSPLFRRRRRRPELLSEGPSLSADASVLVGFRV